MIRTYYNEVDPTAAHVLRALIAENIIAPGEVDERSIVDVRPSDLDGFSQCHFFAGGGLWSVAARLAGWPDDRPLWTGSCPCQPFSVAGKGAGTDDPRHLWPDFFRLIRACRPAVVVGEQVAGSAGYGWFDGVSADLEREGYASRAVDFPSCAVDAPHIRQRLYWCAVEHAASQRRGEGWPEYEFRGRRIATAGASGLDMGHADSSERRPHAEGRNDVANGHDAGRQEAASRLELAGAGSDCAVVYADGAAEKRQRPLGFSLEPEQEAGRSGHATAWSDAILVRGADGKARRVKPGIRLLVDGLPGRVGLLRIGGNAINPVAAAEVLGALMETLP